MKVEEIILKNRPNLSPTSVKTYSSFLKSVFGKLGNEKPSPEEGEKIQEYFRENTKKVLDLLKDKPIGSRKSILSALVIFTEKHSSSETYREAMIKDATAYNREQRDQEKTDKQKENWISQEEVLNVYKKLKKQASPLLKKENLTKAEMRLLQDYVILSLYVLVPPRRILDYCAFKVRNINKEKDNYMEKSKFYFNRYKTADKYKTQVVNIPRSLVNIINGWTKKHNNDYLLFSDNGNPLTSPRLTTRLNQIFGKNISANMLRHIYLTDKFKNIPELRKLDELAEDMGHSVDQALLYKKT